VSEGIAHLSRPGVAPKAPLVLEHINEAGDLARRAVELLEQPHGGGTE
jgi:hypothetical protein